MTNTQLCEKLINSFLALPGAAEMLDETVCVTPDSAPEKTLLPEGDIPSSAKRGEYRVSAKIMGTCGEAYTERPESFQGTLRQALETDPESGISAVTVSAINAAMAHLGLCRGTFPDDPQAHHEYAERLCSFVTEKYGRSNIVLIGYDGYIVKRFVDEGLDFWTLDRDPDNITMDRFNHVIVNSGKYNRESCFAWGNVFIITGSALCNGTLVQYLDKGKDVLLYGITAQGPARLLEIPVFI